MNEHQFKTANANLIFTGYMKLARDNAKTALNWLTDKRAFTRTAVKPADRFPVENAPVLTNSTALGMVRNRLSQIASRKQRMFFGIDPHSSKIDDL
jgi:hypothetical protein